MGANTFMQESTGRDAGAAFKSAVTEARYMNGHGGYTGTIAEKSDFVLIEVPKTWKGDALDYAHHLIDVDDKRISDKWGPAGCIVLESGKFLFFGWASS